MDHPAFKFPDDHDCYLWRYMDFTKFVSMLDTCSLYFARANLLGDPFECSYPKANWDYLLSYQFNVNGVSKEENPEKYEEERSKIAQNNNKTIANIGKYMANHVYVNCWHMNQFESAAMWKLYLQSDEGIAIRTTSKRLRDSLGAKPEEIDIGEIRYIDYDTQRIDETNALNFTTHKRISFSHEREVRAVIWVRDETDTSQLPGFKVPVDLVGLIESVFVAPTAPKWFHELIVAISMKYGQSFAVRQSSLAQSHLR